MKHICFYRESNKFDDIITDKNIKKKFIEKIQWLNHLLVGIEDNDEIITYINLKYGDNILNELVKDRSPIPNIDYIPIRK
jgi:hypothetical protein